MTFLDCCCADATTGNPETVTVETLESSSGDPVEKGNVYLITGPNTDALEEVAVKDGTAGTEENAMNVEDATDRGSLPVEMTPELSEFSVILERVGDEKVGLAIQNLQSKCQIFSVKSGGIAEQWNKKNSTKQIGEGDWIREVNGKTDYEEMKRQLSCEKIVRFTLMRRRRTN